MNAARKPSLLPLATSNNVMGTINPSVIAESATAQAATGAVVESAHPRKGSIIIGGGVAAPVKPSGMVTTSSSERHLTGLKPIVPMRKRGQSFRETKSITTSVDSEGRRRLNQ